MLRMIVCLLAVVTTPLVSAWKENIVAASLAALLTVQPTHAIDINGNSVLRRGQSWRSSSSTLTMQHDGNLVIYNEFNSPIWESGTVGKGWKAVFQSDGNFVVYTKTGRSAWATNTNRHPNSRLSIQDDGNVVVYDGSRAIWNSETVH